MKPAPVVERARAVPRERGLRRWLLALWTCALLLALPAPARAEAAGGLVLEGQIGLGGIATFGEHASCTLRVRLEAGAAPWHGTLRVGVEGVRLGGTEVSLSLAPGSERRVRLTVPLVRGSPYQARLREEGGARGLEVELSDDARQVDERSVALLGGAGWGPLGGDDKLTVIQVAPEDFPLDARVLRGLGALVVPLRADLRDLLSQASFAATLRDYVERGGVVLFSGAADTPRVWVGGPLEPLLPVQDPSGGSLAAAELGPLLGELGVTALPCVRAELSAGARWLESAGRVGICAERPLGKGLVRFLAFDPDAKGVRVASRLGSALRRFVSAAPGRAPAPHTSYDLGALAKTAYEARPALSHLGFALIVGVVLLHALIAVVLAIALRRRKRQPWLAMLLPPLISSGLGVVVILIASLAQAGPEARAVVCVAQSRAEAPGRSPARAVLGLFTQEPASLRLVLGDWSPVAEERSALDALQFREPPPWLQEGERRSLGPIALPGHGHSRWTCAGEAEGLPLIVVESGAAWEVGAARAVEGLYGVTVSPKGVVSWVALGSVGPGQTARFDPSQGEPVREELELEGDPFSDPAALAQLRERAAAGLGWLRAGEGPRFYLLHLDKRPLKTIGAERADEGEPSALPLDALVLTILPVEVP